MGMCDSHLFVPEFSPKGQMALHPPYNRVKAIGAIASHQLWTIGVVALPHTSHTVCTPAEVSSRRGAHAGERGGGGGERYRGTSLTGNNPPHQSHHGALDAVLL